jgi:predicted O-methyltransferase YrrM
MLCWRDYFPNANLYGFEYNNRFIDKAKSDNLYNTIYDEINITDEISILDTLSKYGKFDIIIEDSTHNFNDQVRLINLAHNFLNTGGLLIVEDIFRKESEENYNKKISEIRKYYNTIMFINTEHNLKYSPGWDNDKLLIFIRNDVNII